jgi:hypothetical protein
MNYWRNPPPHLREREAARFPAWLTQIGLTLPKLEVLFATAEPLGPTTWRVRFAVGNAGYLPAYVSKRALERKAARPCVFEIGLPAGATLRSGKPRIEGPQLEGHAAKNSLLAFLPTREITGDRALAEWTVEAPAGTLLTLQATAARAGTVRAEVTLR